MKRSKSVIFKLFVKSLVFQRTIIVMNYLSAVTTSIHIDLFMIVLHFPGFVKVFTVVSLFTANISKYYCFISV